MNVAILKLAIEQAEKSEHNYRVGAVIFKGKKIVGYGYNQVRSCSRIPERYRKHRNSVHAEQIAILNSKRDISGHDILVIRISRKGKLLLARPCEYCMASIDHVGIKNIYYSNELGELVCMKN